MAGQFDNIYADLGNVKPAPGEPIPDDVVAVDQGVMNLEDIKRAIFARAQQQDAARAQMLKTMQEREGALAQQGMNPLDRASMLFQAAGALAAPTRSGAFMESFGRAGTELAGPLSKAAQAERDRQDKIQQLQLARQKMAMEASGVNPSDLLALYKAQQEGVQKPSVQERLIDRLGSETDPKKIAAIRAQLGLEAEETPEASKRVPAEVRALGPGAVKKYVEALGTKVAGEMAAAQSGADSMAAAVPILDRAEKAYKSLGQAGGIGPFSASEKWRAASGLLGTKEEVLRQNYEQAAKELELLQAQIKMKGQGAITEGERRILQMTLPRLDAAKPEVGYETLAQFRNQLTSAIQKPERIRTRGGEGEEPEKPAGKVVDFGSLK